MNEPEAGLLQLIGAGAFGTVMGWYLYFVNRYRPEAVGLGDLASVVGAIGGAAVLALFPKGSDLFGAYGVGLALGFFAYFAALCIMVKRSSNFNVDWFLDGRRNKPKSNQTTSEAAGTSHPMSDCGNGPPT